VSAFHRRFDTDAAALPLYKRTASSLCQLVVQHGVASHAAAIAAERQRQTFLEERATVAWRAEAQVQVPS
jgi:hypothetical protein